MANQIGEFFVSANSDSEAATISTSQHIRGYWDARMRRQIVEYAKTDGAELSEVVRAAILKLETK